MPCRPYWQNCGLDVPDVATGFHIDADFEGPIFLTERPDRRFLVSCAGDAKIFTLDIEKRTASLFVDGRVLGMKDISSCVYDSKGNVWVNEVAGQSAVSPHRRNDPDKTDPFKLNTRKQSPWTTVTAGCLSQNRTET